MALTTTSSTCGNAFIGPLEGLSGLFFRSTSSALPSTVSAGDHTLRTPQGLPLELFLLVMRHVRADDADMDDEAGEGERDLVLASQVCVGWRRAIVGCPQLWDELLCVKAASFNGVDRVRAVAGRSKGSLRRLTLNFQPTSDDMPLSTIPVVVMLKQIFREISTLDGARKLEELELDLRPFRYADDMEAPYQCIVLAAQFAEFSAVNLRTLRCLSRLDRFPSGSPFFFALPTLKILELTSAPYEPPGDARLPDFFSTLSTIQSAQVSSCALEELTLAGTSLMDGNYAEFPALRVLKLSGVKCSNLYGLLSKCAGTLETLVLRGVASDPANRFLPPAPQGDKDLPPTLDLPRLSTCSLAGISTPLLWLAPTQTTPHFTTTCPVLKTLTLSQALHHDQAQADEDGEGLFPAVRSVSTEALSTLFRNSGWLARLDLSCTNVTVDMLVSSFPFSCASLNSLRLGETPAATDAFVDRLDTLVPQLKWLDVYSRPDYEQDVSVMALARLAKRLKGKSPVRRWCSEWSFTGVTREPYTADDPTLSSLRATLRALLVTLSPTQLEHLINSTLSPNSPPNALPYAAQKGELLSLGTPPPPPSTSPFGAVNGVGVNGNGAGGEKPAKKKKQQRGPAPENILAEARTALLAWQKRKEQEGAVEWFEGEEGVELLWGSEGCGDWACDCVKSYPGWEMWHECDASDRE
ncbi:hypothetical protein JCM10213_000166 [Rhodosporidiobolus nylandii]